MFYGLPLNDLRTIASASTPLRLTTCSAWRGNYLKPDRLSIVLVGNASAFVKDLPGVGFPKFEQIELPDLDLSQVSLQRKPGGPAPGGAH